MDPAAADDFSTALGVLPYVGVRASEAPTTGFRGFTLSLVVSGPSTVDSLVGSALDAVFDLHDGLRERITQDGDLRRFVNVYVDGEDIRFGDGLQTPVADGQEVQILPAVAGG